MEKQKMTSFEEMDSAQIYEYYQNFFEQILESAKCDEEAANFQAISIINSILKSKGDEKIFKTWFEALKPQFARAQNYKHQLENIKNLNN